MDPKSIFEKFRPDGWSYVDKLPAGGQAISLIVQNQTGERGVFRTLKKHDDKAIARLTRELSILSHQDFQHPSLVKILSYSPDISAQPWYISRLGSSFETYWQNKRDLCSKDPNALIAEALAVVDHLCAALAALHEKGVVHRDIKPANLVVSLEQPEQPVLIDFGLAYEEGAPRLTSEDEATGNRAFSHDKMRYRLDDDGVPPWLDVFMLSQLLIWMVADDGHKKWHRPWHWRWVKYRDGTSDENLLLLRALTATCSEESVSPKNAQGLAQLISNLFKPKVISEHVIDMSGPSRGRASGTAIRLLGEVASAEILLASHPNFCVAYTRMASMAKSMAESLSKKDDLHVEVVHVGSPDDYVNVSENSGFKIWPLIEIKVRDAEKRGFTLYVSGRLYLPRNLDDKYAQSQPIPDQFNRFTFAIGVRLDESSGKNCGERNQLVTIGKAGQLGVCWTNFEQVDTIGIDGIRSLFESWILDPEAWELLYKAA